MNSAFADLRSFLDHLRASDDLVEINAEVACHLEIAEIHRRVIAAGGPALLFRAPRGHSMPVVTNLFGSPRRVEAAFGRRPRELVERIAALPHALLPPTLGRLWSQRDLVGSLWRVGLRKHRPSRLSERRQHPPRATELPLLTTWPADGGAFVTLPLVYTEHPDGPRSGASNLGVYRMQRYDDRRFGMHWQIAKGGGFHYHVAEQRNQPLPVNVFLGGPPSLILAAVAPLPENLPELLLASLLSGRRLSLADNPDGPLPLVASCEIALIGEVAPHERAPEGPFGDHYGYYSLRHDYPVFRCRSLFARNDAILPATVVGKPRQEDYYIGDFLQELLSPLFPLVMPNVIDLWSYGETGYHSLSAAVVRQRYEHEAMAAAFRILGEGQLSLTKFLLLIDERRDLRDFKATLEHVLERTDLRTDLHVFSNLSMDSLDYNGPRVNEGSKAVLVGVGKPRRRLRRSYEGPLPAGVQKVEVFCGGCLVIQGPGYPLEPSAARHIVGQECFSQWPLLVLVDDAARCARSTFNFLWMTFTRFDPATDLHAAKVELEGLHPSFTGPLLIDSRLRDGFPDELFCDEETARLVERRWKEYFPHGGVEMGDSDRAHLD